MAGAERLPAPPVDPGEALAREASRLPFFPLVAVLERLAGGRVGASADEEPVRFRHDPSLAFSAGDVSRARPVGGARQAYEVVTTFLGLTGSASPLPSYLTEEVAQEDPDRAPKREFLDLFHHRLLALLYRGLAAHGVTHEASHDASDPWAHRVLALAGLDAWAGPVTGALPPARVLRLGALLATRSRSASALEQAVQDVLGEVLAPAGGSVAVRQFVGEWVEIEPGQRLRLGQANTRLGRDAQLGRRVYDRAGAVELVVGPVSFDAYRRLLPGGDLEALVRETVQLVARDPVTWHLTAVLAHGQAPCLQLSRAGQGGRLGRDAWLGQPAGEARVRVPRA